MFTTKIVFGSVNSAQRKCFSSDSGESYRVWHLQAAEDDPLLLRVIFSVRLKSQLPQHQKFGGCNRFKHEILPPFTGIYVAPLELQLFSSELALLKQ